MLSGEARSRPFKNLAHGVEFVNLLQREFRYDKASPRTDHEQAALLKPLKRFAYRGSAHAEVVRNLLLANTLAVRETAIPNCVAQTVIDKIGPRS